jgi:hypothetical protein
MSGRRGDDGGAEHRERVLQRDARHGRHQRRLRDVRATRPRWPLYAMAPLINALMTAGIAASFIGGLSRQ